MAASEKSDGFTSSRRRGLFLELAARKEGATPTAAFKIAQSRGDTVTEEAYYNIARRLTHRGLLRLDETGSENRYFARPLDEIRWLDEDELFSLIDPDYPLPALTIANESAREMRNVPENVWTALRARLKKENARDLVRRAIVSYVEDFAAQIHMLVELEDKAPPEERAKMRREADVSHQLLIRLVRYGL